MRSRTWRAKRSGKFVLTTSKSKSRKRSSPKTANTSNRTWTSFNNNDWHCAARSTNNWDPSSQSVRATCSKTQTLSVAVWKPTTCKRCSDRLSRSPMPRCCTARRNITLVSRSFMRFVIMSLIQLCCAGLKAIKRSVGIRRFHGWAWLDVMRLTNPYSRLSFPSRKKTSSPWDKNPALSTTTTTRPSRFHLAAGQT